MGRNGCGVGVFVCRKGVCVCFLWGEGAGFPLRSLLELLGVCVAGRAITGRTRVMVCAGLPSAIVLCSNSNTNACSIHIPPRVPPFVFWLAR
jgi:hypothetical protein